MTGAGDHVTSQQFVPQAGPRPARHLITSFSHGALLSYSWVSGFPLFPTFPFVSMLGDNPLNYI
jgi:hypothetical protein